MAQHFAPQGPRERVCDTGVRDTSEYQLQKTAQDASGELRQSDIAAKVQHIDVNAVKIAHASFSNQVGGPSTRQSARRAAAIRSQAPRSLLSPSFYKHHGGVAVLVALVVVALAVFLIWWGTQHVLLVS